MADQKISELTALTGANVADDDAIAIVDTSATETKKIVFSELKNALDTATGFVRITGDTMTGALDVQSTITSDGLTSSAVITAQEGRSNTAGTGQIVIDPDDTTVSAAFRLDQTDNKLNIDMNGGGTWKKGFSLYSNNDISFYEDTGTTAKLQWSASNERLFLSGSDYQFGIGQGANQPWYTRAVSDGSYRIHLNGSGDIVTLDSSGNVGIGTSSPSYPLHVSGTGDKVMAVTAGASSIAALNLGNSTNLADGGIRYDNSADALILRASNAEKMRIDSSGNVGIGTSSPTARGHFFSGTSMTQLTVDGTGGIEAGINFANGGTTYGQIYFNNVSPYDMSVMQQYIIGSLVFGTNDTERMRIDSSGNVGIGVVPTTDHNPVVEALQLGTTANLFGRNDAETTTLTSNSYLSLAGYPKYITTNEASEYIQVSGNHIWYNAPSGTAGAACTQTERMRIDSSGHAIIPAGVTLGTAAGVYAAANTLDDYETGEFDATITCGTSGTITLNAIYNRASYVKVGSLVHVQGLLIPSAVSSPTGYFAISLPFTVASLTDRAGDSSGSILVHGSSANVRDYVCMINEGLDQLLVYLGDATTRQEDSANAISANVQINFQCSYRTT
jgi:hypothetical protein